MSITASEFSKSGPVSPISTSWLSFWTVKLNNWFRKCATRFTSRYTQSITHSARLNTMISIWTRNAPFDPGGFCVFVNHIIALLLHYLFLYDPFLSLSDSSRILRNPCLFPSHPLYVHFFAISSNGRLRSDVNFRRFQCRLRTFKLTQSQNRLPSIKSFHYRLMTEASTLKTGMESGPAPTINILKSQPVFVKRHFQFAVPLNGSAIQYSRSTVPSEFSRSHLMNLPWGQSIGCPVSNETSHQGIGLKWNRVKDDSSEDT
jgi:hypothetical protein